MSTSGAQFRVQSMQTESKAPRFREPYEDNRQHQKPLAARGPVPIEAAWCRVVMHISECWDGTR
ncbi:hypothetical protein A9K55_001564 [Cordyceps militaris]|uniref:Uncharacterized protein n=1 Tax=Cordyceps militaris TaxID=73501 RepID=A0A2H4SQL0_CORMI|nr:hypothetical protein A9K55_001564 [Cordyceps militaris]